MKFINKLFPILIGFGLVFCFINISIIILAYFAIIEIDYQILENLVFLSNALIVGSFIVKLLENFLNAFKKVPKSLIEERYDKIPEKHLEKIFVIIPAFNESESIKEAVLACKKFVKNVIVIDDGSEDNTTILAEEVGAIVVKHRINRGLAQAMKTGIKTALKMGAEVIINFDADLQYDANDIPSLTMPVLENRYDLMMGSRLGGKIEKMPLGKKMGNKLFTRLIANLTDTTISDAQSGYRALSADFARAVKIRRGFTYTQQMIIEAAEKNFRIGEIPIVFSERKYGESRLMSGIFHFAFGAGKLLLRVYAEYHPFKLFLFPVITLFVSSLILFNLSLLEVFFNLTNALVLGIGTLVLFSTSVTIFIIALIADSQKETYSLT
jgi:glycosyltransferase involved in cell wall biosynthesis